MSSIPVEDLTPKQIVAELDRYIVGQAAAKRAVAIALRNRYRRQRLPKEQQEDIIPKNILMIGPTGVGKTEIARRLALLAKAPFLKVEATKFTEVGYVGRDVESMIRDLVAVAYRIVEAEKTAEMRPKAEERAIERILDILVGSERSRRQPWSFPPISLPEDEPEEEEPDEEYRAALRRRREKVREQILSGARDDEQIEIEVEESSSPFVQIFSPHGLEEMGLDIASQLGGLGRATKRSVTVGEAKEILTQEEARKLIDSASVAKEAIVRTEQTGIIFLDELDKIAGREGGAGPDVSREGVQRDLLPIIEGSTVATKYGTVRTDHILFIGAGAFHVSKPSDLIPELQGRLPIRVELEDLGEKDLRRILSEPKNALTKQYQALLAADGVNLEFTDEALDAIAHLAHTVNSRAENIGARRLMTVMEKLLEDVMFDAPDTEARTIRITPEYVHEKLADLVEDIDLSKYIL
ncbi:MAG: ATP-dependent protease ATPase subunit HslU [Armatimonadetes bacterium]|nr:MAG: ATP-dependent protease ATPase subunit HslU [Armatimonadota bacterium]